MKTLRHEQTVCWLSRSLFSLLLLTLISHGAAAQTNTFPSSGNVGIGTTSPTDPLHVSSANGVNIRMTDSANSVSSYLTQSNYWSVWQSNRDPITGTKPNSGRPVAGIYFQAFSGDSSIHFQTSTTNGADPTERMVIDKDGNIGIGATAPSSKLHIVGGSDSPNTLLALDTGVHGGSQFQIGGTANNESYFNMNVYRAGVYTTRLSVSSFGHVLLQPGGDSNVGVGTSSPGFKLDVQGGQVNAAGGLCIAGDCKTAWSQIGGSQWNNGSNSISYSGGNVGIGTTAPSDALQLDSNGWGLRIRYTGDGQYLRFSANQISSYTSAGVGRDLYLNTAGGNVGIGTTTPGYKLDVNGTVNATGVNVNGSPITSSQWSTSGATINYGAGNVGIGTTSPGYKLDVNGTVNATGLTVNGSAVASSQWTTSGSNINYAASGGNVGVGQASPAYKLDVNGTAHVSGNLTVDGNLAAKYQDLAEWVPGVGQLPTSTVVVLDSTKSNQVTQSTEAYDTRVAGVISAQPGIALGESGANKVLVATTGRVLVKVDASRGPIHIGDLLVTSDVPGVAMKSEPVNIGGVQLHRPGTLIGKALEPLEKGTGEILVLLSLQ